MEAIDLPWRPDYTSGAGICSSTARVKLQGWPPSRSRAGDRHTCCCSGSWRGLWACWFCALHFLAPDVHRQPRRRERGCGACASHGRLNYRAVDLARQPGPDACHRTSETLGSSVRLERLLFRNNVRLCAAERFDPLPLLGGIRVDARHFRPRRECSAQVASRSPRARPELAFRCRANGDFKHPCILKPSRPGARVAARSFRLRSGVFLRC
mmetsp:Transcript_46036/g.127880  ORF Transcript_46036/g.127880 Transcript_46036/m.127880 type:complete len:211 (+) Transcript_46036:1223-1855(+)